MKKFYLQQPICNNQSFDVSTYLLEVKKLLPLDRYTYSYCYIWAVFLLYLVIKLIYLYLNIVQLVVRQF